MTLITCEQEGSTVSCVLRLVVSELKIQAELIAGCLDVHQVGQLSLFQLKSLLSFFSLQESRLGLSHQPQQPVEVRPLLLLNMSMFNLGIELLVFRQQLLGQIVQH